MPEANNEDVKKQEIADITTTDQIDCDNPADDTRGSDKNSDEESMPSPQQEEEVIKKKYGGISPRKPPLISKDHERAFFDSADWALGKQGAQKPKGPLEALRPKLQPTPSQQVRSTRSAYAPAGDANEEGDSGNNDASPEDQSATEEEVRKDDNATTAQN